MGNVSLGAEKAEIVTETPRVSDVSRLAAPSSALLSAAPKSGLMSSTVPPRRHGVRPCPCSMKPRRSERPKAGGARLASMESETLLSLLSIQYICIFIYVYSLDVLKCA